MPTLDFKGKSFVYSHHLSVPFRELLVEPGRSLPAKARKASLDDNLIIHGDNLEALKALLPRYAGKVDVIYIDPPYNTGNEGWAYNDNVNSPLMKEWLGKVVDRDDLERHDKWCCMMWPRLELLHELLSDTGFLFTSLDDNELANFIEMADEIFGSEDSLVANIIIESNKRGQTYGELAKTHEYLVAYRKLGGELKQVEADADKLPFEDERGGYDLWELRNRNPKFNRSNRRNLYYPIYLSAKPASDGHHRISLKRSKEFPIEVYSTRKDRMVAGDGAQKR
jgi:adenine-specific DNA-methyltransferase